MELIEVLSGRKNKINLFPTSVVEEITQNIQGLLSTEVGTVPLDRKLGLKFDFVDNPTMNALMKAKIFILETIQEYEPRVEVVDIDFCTNTEVIDGKTCVKVRFRILDEYIL